MFIRRFYGIKNKKLAFPIYSGNAPKLLPLSEEHLSKSPFPEEIKLTLSQREWNGEPRLKAIGRKLGMMTLYDEWGVAHPVTAIHFDNVQTLGVHKLTHVHTGYTRLVQEIGAGIKSPHNTPRHLQLYYRRCGVAPKLKIAGSVVKDVVPSGTWIRAGHFIPGQQIDATGKSKGKGFQGGMKRHGFSGFPASHGASLSHRAIGSVGCRNHAKVWRGRKMPGHMGHETVCVKGLIVMKVDNAADVVYVKGSVPGPKKGFLVLKDAKCNPIFKTTPPPYPTFMPAAGMTIPREVIAKSVKIKDPLFTVETALNK